MKNNITFDSQKAFINEKKKMSILPILTLQCKVLMKNSASLRKRKK